MKYICYLCLFFYSVTITCQAQTHNNEIEAELFNCLCQAFSDKGEQLKKELQISENMLIENGVLKDKTGESYALTVKNFEKITIKNSVLSKIVTLDLLENDSNLDTKKSNACLEKIQTNPNFKKSKYYQIKKQMQVNNDLESYHLIKALSSTLTDKDYENEFIKLCFFSAIKELLYEKDISEIGYIESGSSVFEIYLGFENKIIVNKMRLNKEELKKELKKFIVIEKSKSVVFLACSQSKEDFCREIKEVIFAEIDAIRDELSQQKYQKPYGELPYKQKKEIIEICPRKVLVQ